MSSSTEVSPIDVVRAYIRGVEAFDVAAVEPLLAENIQFKELPNRIRPKGGVDDKAAMIAGLKRSGEGKLLRCQRYIMGDIVEAGDRVVVEVRWEGDLAVPVGRLAAGDTMVAHICMIIWVQGGQIVRQHNYDCYEEFSA